MKQDMQKYKNFVPAVAPAPRILAVGCKLADAPVVIVTEKDLPFDFEQELKNLRKGRKPKPFRYTKEQEAEIERERPGVAEVAPYISF
jgi:hypothetical protein